MTIDQNKLAVELDQLNIYPTLGSITAFVDADVNFGFEEILPDDVVIYTDFTDDDLGNDTDAVNEFHTWYNDTLMNQLIAHMDKLGYTFLEDSDGSGGGLYYGGMLFRKA